ncbi:MAG TPA: right-handed parallel beta-helix repeat-containing protein [Phycisphaerae bacterium]
MNLPSFMRSGTYVLAFLAGRAVAQSPDVQIAGPAGSGTNQIRLDMNPTTAGVYEVARRVAPATFTVQLVIYNLTSTVWAVHADLYFDPAAVSYVSIAPGPAFGSAFVAPPLVPPPPPAAGVRIKVDKDFCSAGVGPGTVVVATLTFTGVADKQTGFDVGAPEFFYIPAPCSPGPGTAVGNFALAKGVVVIGDATISCLNVNTTGDMPSINLAARNPDSNPAVGIADISLRSAIQIANAVTGSNRPTLRINGANPTILLSAALPALSDISGGTFLDGATQPVGIVHVNGAAAGASTFSLTSANNTIKSLAVVGNLAGSGVAISGASNKVIGCRLGIDSADASDPNATGIVITGGSGNQIGGTAAGEGNVISGNNGDAVVISGGSGALLRGNKIGTNAAGTAILGNLGRGVVIDGSANNTVGGSSAAARNIISGNTLAAAIAVSGAGATGNLVQGNYIGTDVNGVAAFGNGDGVVVSGGAANTQIGGVNPGERNVISDNNNDGVRITGSASGTLVRGNLIGTNAAGTLPLGNGGEGVNVAATAGPGNVIGGAVAGARNVISTNGADGIRLASAASTVQANFIGTDITGSAFGFGNALNGILIDNAANNLIGGSGALLGNVISRNGSAGISIDGAGASGNGVHNNIIGLNASGTATLGNLLDGLAIQNGASDNIIGTPGTGNTISGNGGPGVGIYDADSNDVQANTIGLNAARTASVPNAQGVLIQVLVGTADVNLIGGDTEAAGNVISGNTGDGVQISGVPLMGFNTIKYNLIGTNAAGAALGNGGDGVQIDGGALSNGVSYNQILANGGDGVFITGLGTDNNQIAFNSIGNSNLPNQSNGVFINNGASGNSVAGNTIRSNLANGAYIDLSDGNVLTDNQIEINQLNGVLLTESSATFIGMAGRGNVISGNGADGIMLLGAPGNVITANTIRNNSANGIRVAAAGIRISQNAIFANDLLGIDLVPGDGVTPNDAGDADSGGNSLQNFPTLTSVSSTSASGTLNSAPSTVFTLEFFANASCDPSGYGEGASFVGSAMVTTDSGGNAIFSVTFNQTVPVLQFITATATDPVGNTSEFAACVQIPETPALVNIVSANPPLDNPFIPEFQPFRDVLQDLTPGPTPPPGMPQGIGVAGTPNEGPYIYSAFSVTFSSAPSPVPAADNISVTCTGGACPAITTVASAGTGSYTISLSAPPPARQCTTFTFAGVAPSQKLQYQSLPGDVDMDGIVNTTDLTGLVHALVDGSASLAGNLARYDLDRSGAANTGDLLRLVQLLNGTNATQVFNGATVAACPP